jgi:hypothetical protein
METAGSIAVNGDAGRPRHFLAASQKLGILFSKNGIYGNVNIR